ncbi:chromate transporter [Pontibacter ummariensis]|uniref:Chromate transporter n=1 Tax=Pontibacter ummariensis TaxID=1610492 RepID=A0A239HC52_9BACT|nr:chromate efflux transporter [Pontibacter ummariensis]PRY10655.1 chromate transporter [Pontibacter ummariensis]SNS78957.1 chromate transporter [Pontibacter ummariensis]
MPVIPATATSSPNKPGFKEAFYFWLKLGFISFGGPAGQIGIMHAFVVEQKKWVSDSRFLHALNYCMLLPGPEAQQLATYIGWLLHGVRGGLTAGILFVLPSVFILLGLSLVYVTYGSIPWVAALFYGLKPAVVAIVALALVKIGKKALVSGLHYGLALLSFVLIYFLEVPFPFLILGAAGIALFLLRFSPRVLKQQSAEEKRPDYETGYYINSASALPQSGFSWKRMAKQLSVAALLWVVPFLLFYLLLQETGFWNRLSLFFTKAALVTFGGAYAVLPYVAQVAVEKFNWLSSYQMIDGLALGETTPGPLVMVLAFVGFMAGYNYFAGSLLMGTLGLLVTTYYTFLPCFLFILVGAPVVENSQSNVRVKAVLNVITAAVVGVVLNLTVYFGQAVVIGGIHTNLGIDYFALGWIVVSLLAMYRYKVGMIPWIGISALAGLVMYLLGYCQP